MRVIRSLSLIILALIIIAFAISNAEEIQLYYYFGSVTLPFSLALGLSLVLGCLLGVLSCLKVILRSKYEIRTLTKEVAIANKEISNLRAIPIKDVH